MNTKVQQLYDFLYYTTLINCFFLSSFFLFWLNNFKIILNSKWLRFVQNAQSFIINWLSNWHVLRTALFSLLVTIWVPFCLQLSLDLFGFLYFKYILISNHPAYRPKQEPLLLTKAETPMVNITCQEFSKTHCSKVLTLQKQLNETGYRHINYQYSW